MVDLPEPGSLAIENKEIQPPTVKISSYAASEYSNY